MKKSILIAVLSLSLIGIISCKKAEDESNDNEKVLSIEKSVAFTAAVLNSTGSTVMNTSSGLNSFFRDNLQSNGLNYNPVTGWWTLETTLETGESAEIQIQFIDSHGDFRKFYTNIIKRINTKGTITGNNGSLTFEMNITGLEDGDEDVIFNGSGSVTYMGVTSTFTVNNVVSVGYNDYATSGTITVNIEGVTISVNYNGTSKITVSFTYNGHNYTFTIDLETGNIS